MYMYIRVFAWSFLPKGERQPLSRHERGTHAVVWSLILSLEVVYYGPCARKTTSGERGSNRATLQMLAKLQVYVYIQEYKFEEIAIDLHTVSSNGSAKLFQVSPLAHSYESSPIFKHRQPKPGIASYSWGRAREKMKHAAVIVKRFSLHNVLDLHKCTLQTSGFTRLEICICTFAYSLGASSQRERGGR